MAEESSKVRDVFTDNGDYVPANERKRFSRALGERDYELAREILEKLPVARTDAEKILRVRTLIEGYRSILNTVLPSLPKLQSTRKELEEYAEKVGSLEFGIRIFGVVEEHMAYEKAYGRDASNNCDSRYEDVGDKEKLAMLRLDLRELRDYRELGEVNECEDYKTEAEREKPDLSPLESI